MPDSKQGDVLETPLYDLQDFQMSCTVSGSNIDRVEWYKDNYLITDSDFTKLPLKDVADQNFTCDQSTGKQSDIKWKAADKTFVCSNVTHYDGTYFCTGFGVAAGQDNNNQSVNFVVEVQCEYSLLQYLFEDLNVYRFSVPNT